MRYSFKRGSYYMGSTDYKVTTLGCYNGGATIDVFETPSATEEAIVRRYISGGDAAYDMTFKPAWGGAKVLWHNGPIATFNRWTPDLWSAFTEYLKAKEEEELAWVLKFRAEHPDTEFSPIEPMEPLRPIYWDNGWKDDLKEGTNEKT